AASGGREELAGDGVHVETAVLQLDRSGGTRKGQTSVRGRGHRKKGARSARRVEVGRTLPDQRYDWYTSALPSRRTRSTMGPSASSGRPAIPACTMQMDRIAMTLERGGRVLVAGAPGTGKSTFAAELGARCRD